MSRRFDDEDYNQTYGGTVGQTSHLNGQVEQLASRMPTSQQWEMAARNAEAERQQDFYGRIVGDQNAVYKDAETMMNAVRQKQAAQNLNMQYSNATLMKMAQGGAVPPQMIAWWNTRNRSNDSDAQLQSAGYDKNGNFNMVFADQNGQQVMTATPLTQYQMANNMPGIFSDQDRIGMHDALLSSGHSDQELSKYSSQLNVIGGANITHNRPVSANANLTTGEISGFGGRPGPRARFVSEDDLNGRPYRDPEKPGERYLGHGISSFSTADWQEDREEKRNPNGRWVETAVGPSDTFNGGVGLKEGEKADNSQVRTYKNTKTGEVVRVKDGETPPWRRNDAVEIARAKQRNGSGRSVEDQMAIDDNRAKNAKQAQEDKRDSTLRKLYLDRVVKDEKAIDEYAKSRKKPRKGRHGEEELTEEELAKADEDIAKYRKQREETRAKDFEGFDFGKKGDGAGGDTVTQQQGTETTTAKPQKKEKIAGEVSKGEYDKLRKSGRKGHIHHDSNGAHYVIDDADTSTAQQQGSGSQAAGKKEDNVSTASEGSERPTDEEWKKMSTAEKRAWLKAHNK